MGLTLPLDVTLAAGPSFALVEVVRGLDSHRLGLPVRVGGDPALAPRVGRHAMQDHEDLLGAV